MLCSPADVEARLRRILHMQTDSSEELGQFESYQERFQAQYQQRLERILTLNLQESTKDTSATTSAKFVVSETPVRARSQSQRRDPLVNIESDQRIKPFESDNDDGEYDSVPSSQTELLLQCTTDLCEVPEVHTPVDQERATNPCSITFRHIQQRAFCSPEAESPETPPLLNGNASVLSAIEPPMDTGQSTEDDLTQDLSFDFELSLDGPTNPSISLAVVRKLEMKQRQISPENLDMQHRSVASHNDSLSQCSPDMSAILTYSPATPLRK